MSNQTFVFKQFAVKQDKCAMKVGTDAVILGAYVNTKDAKKILDIGTGTGVIALMLAQKSFAHITAIEIEKEAYEQALENVLSSNWADRINVQNISFQNFYNHAAEKFDLIVSNPPYFIGSLKSKVESRSFARNNDTLPFLDLVFGVKKIMDINGHFYLILPKKEAEIFREIAEKNGLHLSKLIRIRTKQESLSDKRHVMLFENTPKSYSEETITIETQERHDYTNEYKALTKDYYLAF